jgi:hypothetical protein
LAGERKARQFPRKPANRALVKKPVLNDNPEPAYGHAGEKPQLALIRPVKIDMYSASYHRSVIVPPAMQRVDGIKAEDFDERFPALIRDARVRAKSVIHILYQEAGSGRELADIAVREASIPRPAIFATVSEYKAELAVLDDSPGHLLICQNIHCHATCSFCVFICPKITHTPAIGCA